MQRLALLCAAHAAHQGAPAAAFCEGTESRLKDCSPRFLCPLPAVRARPSHRKTCLITSAGLPALQKARDSAFRRGGSTCNAMRAHEQNTLPTTNPQQKTAPLSLSLCRQTHPPRRSKKMPRPMAAAAAAARRRRLLFVCPCFASVDCLSDCEAGAGVKNHACVA